MAGEEGTTENGKIRGKRKKDFKTLLEAEVRRKNGRTKPLLEKRSEKKIQ